MIEETGGDRDQGVQHQGGREETVAEVHLRPMIEDTGRGQSHREVTVMVEGIVVMTKVTERTITVTVEIVTTIDETKIDEGGQDRRK